MRLKEHSICITPPKITYNNVRCFIELFVVLVCLFVFSAKIQALKHSVPKGDKKKKKEVALEIAKLEEDLSVRHKNELDSLQSDSSVSSCK